MNYSLKSLLVIGLCLAFALALLFWAIRRRKKTWPSLSNESFLTKCIPFCALFLGVFLGTIFPLWIPQQNSLISLAYALLIGFLIGVPEILLIRRLPNKLNATYLLNGETFPYFAIGFSVALIVFR